MKQSLLNSKILFKNLGLVLLLFSVCRLLFLVFNHSYFADYSPLVFVAGLRFDLVAISQYYAPFILLVLLPVPFRSHSVYRLVVKIFFHAATILTLMLNCMDIEYFKFTLKRTTSDIFSLVGFGDDFFTLLPRFLLDYWYVVLIWLLLIAFAEWMYRKINQQPTAPAPSFHFKWEAITMLLLAGLFVILARGGLQLKPISIIHAGQYATPRNIPLVLNTPFSLLRTLSKEKLTERHYFDAQVEATYFRPETKRLDNDPMSGKNVVILIMESFSREYIGRYNKGETSYTPVLDSLMANSLVFTNCYANGKKSIEAVPAIVSSLPSLMETPYISSHYSTNQVNSLASLLSSQGYQTSFYHGGTNGTMNFEAFSATVGFSKYVGRNEYPDEADYDDNWGIYDEPFFQFFAHELNQSATPFFSTFFSLTSHHPFSVPKAYEGVFEEGSLPILKTIRYSDYSLGQFMKTASRMPWFENTLFIITADHTATPLYPKYNSDLGSYAIPLIFYAPGDSLQGVDTRITQQTDILPSVLSYLNYSGSYVAFGQSVFEDNTEGYAVNYLNSIYQLITDQYLLQFDGDKSIGLYEHQNGLLNKTNLLNTPPENWVEQEKKMQAIIQTYNRRMLRNQLVAP